MTTSTPSVALSRRALIGAAASAATVGSTGLLSACERSDPGPKHFGSSETDATVDLDILSSAVDIENLMIAVYRAILPLLAGANLALARRLQAQEQAHLTALSQIVRLGGATPNPPRSHYGFPALANAEAALAFATDMENTAIASYIDALPKIAHPSIRVTAAAIMTSEAEHVSVLAGARHLPPAPNAFVLGRV